MPHTCVDRTPLAANRRAFAALAFAASLLAGRLCAAPAGAARPTVDLTGPWHLFVDDYFIDSRNGVTRTYHPFTKSPANPVMVVDQPWEHDVINCEAVRPSEDGQSYRMWYYCWTPRNDPDHGHELYATSTDGIHWTKPALGIMPWRVTGSTATNIIGGGASLMFTPQDPDAGSRYKAITYKKGWYYMQGSPDGLHWRDLSTKPMFTAGDTCYVFRDPLTNRYRGYGKLNVVVNGLLRRGVGFGEQTAVDNWPKLRLVLAPDDVDDRWVPPGSIQRAHFYKCAVFAYQDMYIGFLWLYRAQDEEGYFHGPIYLELVTSRDGIHWRREDGDRPALLANGPERSWDHGMLAIDAALLRVGNELHAYYSGYDGLHDYLPFHSAIGLATMRVDGFASMDGGDIPGSFTTKPLRGLKGKLHVNCNASAGLLQVEVLDASGKVLPDFRRKFCNEPRTDTTDAVVTWEGHDELPASTEPLRLRFWLKNAAVYSFHTDAPIEVVAAPPASAVNAVYTFEADGHAPLEDQLAFGPDHALQVLGTSKLDRDATHAAFGRQSIRVDSLWRPLNTLEIPASTQLGTHFSLAIMARSTTNRLARLFSAASGNGRVGSSELVFDYDASGRVLPGLRLIVKGIAVESQPLSLADGKYHQLGVTYDDGHVQFYCDGRTAGDAWVPGGDPVALVRNLRVGEDAALGSDEQFIGNVDDIVALGRVLSPADFAALADKGAAAVFAPVMPAHPPR